MGGWYKYDDCNVTKVIGREYHSKDAYILFYEKVNNSQQNTMEED